MSKRRQTKQLLVKYAKEAVKKGKFEWEKIAEEIRQKDLDYDYYESFFTVGPGAYDWVNGNKKWKKLLEIIKQGLKTPQIIREMDY